MWVIQVIDDILHSRVISRSNPTNTSDNIFEPLSWPDHSVREEESRDEPALLSLIRPDDLPNVGLHLLNQ